MEEMQFSRPGFPHSAILAEDGKSGRIFMNKPADESSREHGAEMPEYDSWDQFGRCFVCMDLAGCLAELRVNGVEPDRNELILNHGLTDLIHARRWAGRYRQDAVLLACQRIALVILRENWQSVVHIAAVLRAQGRAAGEEIDHLMRRSSTLM